MSAAKKEEVPDCWIEVPTEPSVPQGWKKKVYRMNGRLNPKWVQYYDPQGNRYNSLPAATNGNEIVSNNPPIPVKESALSLNVAPNVQIKKEAHSPEEVSTGLEEPMEQQQADPAILANSVQPQPSVTPTMTGDTEDLKNQCEKCRKAFASLTLLRYHYCSHFRSILKKKFANLFDDNKCLECLKTFANPGRLLLHIGVQHDKINDILKSKGITQLPPFSATAAAEEASGNAGNTQQSHTVSKDSKKPYETQSNDATPFRDIKNIPLISSPSETSDNLTIENVRYPSSSTEATPEPSNVSSNETSYSAISNASSVTPSASDKNNDSTTECNYELECQVCDQKLKTISLLEQHCCRQFMKDLQDQYSSLMKRLKCNICNNTFKQKHSLLLHIGCKHGKINDILKQKNFSALPCPVTNTSSAAMQKQLIQIKKEKIENMKEENFNNTRSRSDEETPREASITFNDTPSVPASE